MSKIKLFFFKLLEKTAIFFGSIGINKKTPGMLAIYNFFYSLLWPYGKIIEIQGSKMHVGIAGEKLSMRRTFEAYSANEVHEQATTDLFKSIIRKGDTFLDLGANIGYFTLLAANLVGKEGRVFSFEPEPKNYNYLKRNMALNGYNQVQAFQKAVADKNGKTSLFICDYDTGHHTINKYDGIRAYSRGRGGKKHSIEIETVTLDSFLEGKVDRVNVIKMDVEGAEALALTGMDKILRNNKDIKMILEFFPLLIENMGSDPREFLRKLFEDYGFSIYIIPDDYNSQSATMQKLNTAQEVLNHRKEKDDHINLFLKRK